MTFTRLALRSLAYYWRTNAAVALGVAGGVAVLAGSLLVGASVRDSLRSIAASRLGAASIVVGAQVPFSEALAARLAGKLPSPVAPLLSLSGVAVHESSARRAGHVNVYGVDARFFAFHGVNVPAPSRSDAWISTDLAAELGVVAGDALVVRLARPTDIPIDSLHGRRDEVGRSIRLTVRGTLAREHMGDFTLAAGQGPARGVFLALATLQRSLGIDDRVNTLMATAAVEAATVRDALAREASVEDLGLTVTALPDSGAVLVESRSGLIPDPIAASLSQIAAKQSVDTTPVLTWLATRMTVSGRTVPYSLVTALGPDASGDPALAGLLAEPASPAPIVLDEWAARDLQAATGAALDLEYLKWTDDGRLVTEHAAFRVAGIAPMRGLAVDRRLAPDYPGITTAAGLGDWDPPFPIDLGLVRPQDEAYWRQYRTAPKAFIPLAAGQTIWRTRHGQLTSLRMRPGVTAATPDRQPADLAASLRAAIARGIDPAAAGITVVDVRRQNLAASAGATDFGAYFSYFSFFLMISALLLAVLFFRLSIEQRLSQIGVLRATGFSLRDVRLAFLIEGAGVAAAGAVIGACLAIGWAALMMLALRTWWVDAVGTTLLRLHVDPMSIVIGAASAAVAAMLAILWTVRALSRTTPRAQIAGAGSESVAKTSGPTRWMGPAALLFAALLSASSFAGLVPAAGGFFGAGALILVGGLAALRSRIGGARRRAAVTAGMGSVAALGLRNASWRPGRSLAVAGLVAAAVFLLVSVDSFRKTVGAEVTRDGGTGGFALIAESALPIVHNLGTAQGRSEAGLTMTEDAERALGGMDIYSLRLRPGDDASCLNLYQPRQPRIVGVPDRLIAEGRFSFAKSVATDAAGRSNPWTLLGPPDANGVVAAIVDATSLEYVLHASVGDEITVDADTARPLRLRIVASLADSVMQGEILIAETAFRTVFPDIAGYRVFLISIADPAPERPERIDAVTRVLESSLDPFGFDAEATTRRLEAFHRVENTYLSTFQALGGLGLVLGCLGLAAVVLRNVLERRRELALLGAAGFTGRDLQTLVAVEHLALVGAGLAIGIAAAAVAVAPVVVARGGGAPWHALVWILPVAAAGLLAAVGATRSLRKMPLVASLRSE